METLDLEVARLGVQLRRQRLALLVVAVAAAVSLVAPLRAASPPGVVDAQHFRLLDSDGKVRANLMLVNGMAALGLLDETGSVRVLLTAGEQSAMKIAAADHAAVVAPFGISFEHLGTRLVNLGAMNGKGALGFNGSDGKPATILNRQMLMFTEPPASLQVGLLKGRAGILAKDATGAERVLDLASGAAKPLAPRP